MPLACSINKCRLPTESMITGASITPGLSILSKTSTEYWGFYCSSQSKQYTASESLERREMPPSSKTLVFDILMDANLLSAEGMRNSIRVMRRRSISYRSIESRVPASLL